MNPLQRSYLNTKKIVESRDINCIDCVTVYSNCSSGFENDLMLFERSFHSDETKNTDRPKNSGTRKVDLSDHRRCVMT